MATEDLRRAGGLLEKFSQLISLAGYLDEAAALLPLAKEWLAIDADWGTVAGLKARAAVIVAAGKILSAATTNTADDAIVAQFEALTQNDSLVETVAWLITRFRAETPGGTAAQFQAFIERPDVQESLAEKQGISVNDVMTIVQLIMQLVTLLKGMFGGTTGGTAGGTTGTDSSGGIFDF